MAALGYIGDRLFYVVFVVRGEARRFISLRKANQREVKRYAETSTDPFFVSDAEDAVINAAALSDPDAMPFTDAEWAAVKPGVRIGRPKAEVTKERITIRLSRDVVTQFRATGEGWQTRMDLALRQYIAEHPITP
jgi:uncharacterized protein (DUF4415 family)